MIGQLNDLYSNTCENCGGIQLEDLSDDDDWDAIYRQIAEDLLSGSDEKINKDLLLKTANKLMEAVNKGIEYGDQKDLLEKLVQNIYKFSAAKSLTQMKYYRDMMMGDDGKILGVESYIKKIADTGEIFNKRYLEAEYENAYYSTIMADKWNRFSDDELLEYSTAGDSHVRASHKLLDKYTAPKSDPFWKTNFPPNGWGCRCTVIPGKNRNVSEREQERFSAGINSLKNENEGTIFYKNVGLTTVLFDENKHPYFKNLKTELSSKEIGKIKGDAKNWSKVQNMDYGKEMYPYRDPLLKRYKGISFKKVEDINNGILEIFTSGRQTREEFNHNKEALTILANAGRKYRMLPIIADGKGNPDALNKISGRFVDVKATETTKGINIIQNSLKAAADQNVPEVIIYMQNRPTSMRDLYIGIKLDVYNNRNPKLEKLTLIFPNKTFKEYDYKEIEKKIKARLNK